MLYQIKTILVTLTLFWEMGKSYGLKKNEKKTKSILTFCTVKAAEQKRVGYLSLDVNILEIVKQSYFSFQGCEFHDLITVRDCSYLTSTSFLSKLTSCPSPINFCWLFAKSLPIVDVSFSKLILPLKKKKSKNKNSNINNSKSKTKIIK